MWWDVTILEGKFAQYLLPHSTWKVDIAGDKAGWSPVNFTDVFALATTIMTPSDPLIPPVGNGTSNSVSPTTMTLTLLYMKSWGEKWMNSTAEVTVWIDQRNSSTNEEANPAIRHGGGDRGGGGTFFLLANETLVGYHYKETSEIYPFELEFSTSPMNASTDGGEGEPEAEGATSSSFNQHPPGNNNDEISRIKVEVRLKAGSTFKIMGLAICRTK